MFWACLHRNSGACVDWDFYQSPAYVFTPGAIDQGGCSAILVHDVGSKAREASAAPAATFRRAIWVVATSFGVSNRANPPPGVFFCIICNELVGTRGEANCAWGDKFGQLRFGTPDGPPPESDLHSFGIPMPGNPDARLIFLNCIRHPNQLQPTMDNMMAQFAAEQAKRAAQHHKQ
jgi:hypothetical protein